MHVRWRVKILIECREKSEVWDLSQTIARSHIMLQTCSHIRKRIFFYYKHLEKQRLLATASVVYNRSSPLKRDTWTTEEKEINTPPNNDPLFAFTLSPSYRHKKRNSASSIAYPERGIYYNDILQIVWCIICVGFQHPVTSCSARCESSWVSLTKVTKLSWNMQERHLEELKRGGQNGD